MSFLDKIFGASGVKLSASSSGDSVIGIDVGSSSIKLVQMKKKGGRAVLETYGAIALGPYEDKEAGRSTNLPPEKISEAISELVKQSGVTTTKCALSISVQASLIFIVDLPFNIKTSEIPNVIPIEARKHIPVPMSEVSIDYFVLPEKEPSFEEMNTPDYKPPERFREVLSVAIQKEEVEKLRTVVNKANLTASFFEVEVFSSVRSNLEHELYPVLIMDFGATRTKLSFIEFGMIKNYHTIHRGGADISQAISQSLSIEFEKAEEMKKEFGVFGSPNEKDLAEIIKVHLDYIFSETNSVLLNYEKKYGKSVSKIILSGGGASMKGLKELSLQNFKADVVLSRPFSKVDAPVFLQKVLESSGPDFAVAIGLALRKLQQ